MPGKGYWRSKPPADSQIDRSHPLAQGLIGHWAMNESSGIFLNDWAYGNNGSLNGTVSWKSGKLGSNVPIFDGSTTFMSVAHSNSFDLSKPFSCVLWFNSTSIATTQTVGSRGPTGADAAGRKEWGIFSSKLYYNAFGGGIVGAGATTLLSNTWYQFACVYDGATIYNCLNGRLDGSGAQASTADNAAHVVHFGNSKTASNFLVGQLDNVSFYSRALTLIEVEWLYSEPFAAFAPPVWRRYFVPSGQAPRSMHQFRQRVA
jgi:hypothetical protein